MHGLIKDRLEDYLSSQPCAGGGSGGVPSPGWLVEVEEHLEVCRECRELVSRMRAQCLTLRSLRPPVDCGPAPGFYGRLMRRIEERAQASVWSVFLEPAFSRRLAYSSLALLLLLAGILISLEPGNTYVVSEPEAILAEEVPAPPLGYDQERDRDVILVNLATYADQ